MVGGKWKQVIWHRIRILWLGGRLDVMSCPLLFCIKKWSNRESLSGKLCPSFLRLFAAHTPFQTHSVGICPHQNSPAPHPGPGSDSCDAHVIAKLYANSDSGWNFGGVFYSPPSFLE